MRAIPLIACVTRIKDEYSFLNNTSCRRCTLTAYRELMMPALVAFPERFRDNDEPDIEDQIPSPILSDDSSSAIPPPKWWQYGRGSKSQSVVVTTCECASESLSSVRPAKRKRTCRILLVVVAVLAFFALIAGLSYITLVNALIRRIAPSRIDSGLQRIVDDWKEPGPDGAHQFQWTDDFSRDIVPKNCHSHNDYWRSVPLYEALAAGCVGVEADIWLMDDGELRVSHTWRTIKTDRTLRNLYLDPLASIFTNRNVSLASAEEKEIGVFDADPNASVTLLIDFKNDGHKIWPVLLEQLRPLHEKGWLTYFDGSKVIQGPLTIVGTGNTPFELVQENNDNRIVFFDAPLDDVSNPAYTTENSYYASIQLRKAIGRLWLNKLTSNQIDLLKQQIKAAADKGLKSRYWGTPSWPISLRDKVWLTLSENDVGMLNVDDLASATRWNWNLCVIAGLNLCGNS